MNYSIFWNRTRNVWDRFGQIPIHILLWERLHKIIDLYFMSRNMWIRENIFCTVLSLRLFFLCEVSLDVLFNCFLTIIVRHLHLFWMKGRDFFKLLNRTIYLLSRCIELLLILSNSVDNFHKIRRVAYPDYMSCKAIFMKQPFWIYPPDVGWFI